MASEYHPAAVERDRYDWWRRRGDFGRPRPGPTARSAAGRESDDGSFSVLLPPPNVTGALHLGHALTATIQDALARFHRMEGRDVAWIPGLDHAGIATQYVVEQRLLRAGRPGRRELGREAFVAEVWKWKEEFGGRIDSQLVRLGASLDWDLQYFTLDDRRSEAVRDAFVRLFDQGLVYRKRRMINWCPYLRTAVSDIEVEHVEVSARQPLRLPGRTDRPVFGVIHDVLYPLVGGGASEGLVVSTTRPETMLGDVAVAVHPEDDRYRHLVGRFVVEPVTGRHLPVVADAVLVDREFGTGVVKVTPSHDPNDLACAERLGLPMRDVFCDDGTIGASAGAPALQGLDRFEARGRIVGLLAERGAYRGARDHPMRIGLCSRSGDVLEPMLKPQWFVDVAPMAARACDLVRAGRVELLPEQHRDTWFRWLENVQPWCISRQLWWGHRVPAYRVAGAQGAAGGEEDGGAVWVSGRDEPEALRRASALLGRPVRPDELEQDPDVLDTWFSSALLPLSAAAGHGYYPLTLMETGSDILFFWVARMVMMCTHLHPDGLPPFRRVYLHPMVRDAQGRKMSKSLGNVVDPIEVMEGCTLDQLRARLEASQLDPAERARSVAALQRDMPNGISECGADGLRLALAGYLVQGRSINMDPARAVASRHFCNKLWQAARFVLAGLSGPVDPLPPAGPSGLAGRWLLRRVRAAVREARRGLEQAPDLALAAHAGTDLVQRALCDVYIEHAKQFLRGDDAAARREVQSVLVHVLEAALRMLHPLAPFVTEALYEHVRPVMPASPHGPLPESVSRRPFPSETEAVTLPLVEEKENGGEGDEQQQQQREEEEEEERTMEALLGAAGAFRSLRSHHPAQFPAADDSGGATGPSEPLCVRVTVENERLATVLARHADVLRFHCRGAERVDVSAGRPDAHVGRLVVAAVGGAVKVSVPVARPESLRQDLEVARARLRKTDSALASLVAAIGRPDYAARVPAAVQETQRARREALEGDVVVLGQSVRDLEELIRVAAA